MSKYVDWSALGKVLGIGLGAGAGAVILFSIGVVGVAQYAQGREEQQNKIGGLALAVVCFAVCLAAVGYGIVLMTDK